MGIPVRIPGPTTTGATRKWALINSSKTGWSGGTTDAMITPLTAEGWIPTTSKRFLRRIPYSSAVPSRRVPTRQWCKSSRSRKSPSTMLVLPMSIASNIATMKLSAVRTDTIYPPEIADSRRLTADSLALARLPFISQHAEVPREFLRGLPQLPLGLPFLGHHLCRRPGEKVSVAELAVHPLKLVRHLLKLPVDALRLRRDIDQPLEGNVDLHPGSHGY